VIPLDKVTTLPHGCTPDQIEQIAANGFSRFPVQARTGELTGYVHVKDLLGLGAADRDRPLPTDLIRDLPRVRLDDGLRVSLRRMQREGAHLALAADGGGRPYGIVTLEDMLEELVGQIRDNSRASRTAAPTTAFA
jgi:CBS domain containing-hemolysin-like protein